LAAGPLVDISLTGTNEDECTIAINPTNLNNMFAASNNADGTPDLEWYSFDGGQSWSRTAAFPQVFPPPDAGDQQAVFDNFGNLYMVYLTKDPMNPTGHGYPCWAVSTDGGRSFSIAQKFAHRGDQPSVAVGPGGIFTEVQVAITYQDKDSSSINVRATGVLGLGNIDYQNWNEVQLPGTENASFGSVAVGPDGTVLIDYEKPINNPTNGTIYANHSSALLQTGFGMPVAVATTGVGGIFGPTRANNNNKVSAEANLAWDRSGLVIGNPVYLVFTDVRAQFSDQTNIMVCTSTDDGRTWSAPTRISDDVASTKILPAVAVDPTSGYVAVAWYDTRNDNKPVNSDVDVYATIGVPGGTWRRMR
jgi:hypothetical protein